MLNEVIQFEHDLVKSFLFELENDIKKQKKKLILNKGKKAKVINDEIKITYQENWSNVLDKEEKIVINAFRQIYFNEQENFISFNFFYQSHDLEFKITIDDKKKATHRI